MDIYTPLKPKLPSLPEKIDDPEELRKWMVSITDSINDVVSEIRQDILNIIEGAGL